MLHVIEKVNYMYQRKYTAKYRKKIKPKTGEL